MTLQEACQILNKSECTLKTHFVRTKKALENKGIILTKEKKDNNIEYYIDCKNPLNLSILPKGFKINRLTILDYEKRDGLIHYKCQCDCGNIVTVRSSNLKNGNTKSCGCFRKEVASEKAKMKIPIGTKFGLLTVIDRTEKRDKSGNCYWLCKCDCGNTKEVITHNLIKNIITSCGCIKKSKGEQIIENILRNNNIDFQMQKFFNDCKFLDTNYPAYFDFYVDNKYIIEYDGEPHFKAKGSGWNTKENLNKTQKHDQFKNQYCKEHNIPIIRIPYTHFKNICLEDLIPETSKFLVEQ